MPQDEKKPIRWVTTKSPRHAVPQAEASNNIPSMYSKQENASDNRASNLLFSPTAKTSFQPANEATSQPLDAAFASASATSAAVDGVNEGYIQNSCFDSVIVNRITATPRKIQTQIAKISYPCVNDEQTFHTTQRPCVPTTTMVGRIHLGASKPRSSSSQSTSSRSYESLPKSSAAEFNKRKNERDQEIREIVNMLNEIQNDSVLINDIDEEESVQKPTAITTAADHSTNLKENIPQDDIPIAPMLKEPTQPKPTPRTATLNINKHNTATAATSFINNTQYERSKTDINLLPIKAASTRRNRNQMREKQTAKRSKSTQPPETKSNELLPEDMNKKPPAYDREATRRFMEEQRKKRRNAANLLTTRSDQAEKEQIKKRLEELRKNSKKIVTKNLKNAQKRTPSTNLNEVSPSKTARMEIMFKRPADRKILNRNKNIMKTSDETKNEMKSSLEAHKTNENLPKANTPAPVPHVETSKTKLPPSALQENQKRIGLLRKPELRDHSFSAIKDFSFDKENVAIEMMTPKIDPARFKSKLIAPTSKEDNNAVSAKAIVEESKNEEHDLNLEMPSARLRPRPETREITVQVQETPSLMGTKLKDTAAAEVATTAPPKPTHIEINENVAEKQMQNMSEQQVAKKELPPAAEDEQNDTLPYWLKPSAVQIYPYNFIMAVRRKLEAIANPVHIQPTSSKTALQENKNTSTTNLDAHNHVVTPLTSLSKQHNLDAQHKVKRKLIPAADKEPSEYSFATHTIETNKKLSDKLSLKSKPAIHESRENTLKSQTFSDITSNFSSISLQVPASNTVSEVSSIKSECFHYTAPKEKSKIVATTSHLAARASEDDDTTVSSSIFNSPEKKLSHKQAGFEFVAPRPVSPLSLKHIDNLKINTKGKLKEAINSGNVIIERGHGDNVRSRRGKQKHTSMHDAAQAEEVSVNFNRLLDDFNRSLSQVIEVNEQLKSTLNRSEQICTERMNRQNSKSDNKRETNEYSSDFEATSSKLVKIKPNDEHAVKQRTVEMEKSLHQRKKELFVITNAVKPLLSSSQTPTKSITKKDIASNLNFESAENSSTNSKQTKTILSAQSFAESTSHLMANEAFLSSSHSGDSLDKRLHNIEKFKLNLKKSIFKSQENRKKVDADSMLTSSEDNENHSNQDSMIHEVKVQHVENTSSTTTELNAVDSKKAQESIQQTTDVSELTTAATLANSLEATLNITDSPKAKTFLITSATHSVQTPPNRDSTDLESKSISEELQYATENCSQDNKNVPHQVNQNFSHHCKTNYNKLKNSSSSSISTPNKSQREEFILSHINNDRGDFLPGNDVMNDSHSHHTVAALSPTPAAGGDVSSEDSAAPPSYNALPSKYRTPHTKVITAGKSKTPASSTTLGKEIVAIFNQSDLELSIISSQNGSLSETSLNYSSVGVYERLIKNETTKSEHLTALLKMREKALIDRTKGQIAWLEVQKERYKAKGLLAQISAIKKKQRGILLKMEREREGIKRLLQSTTSTTTTSTHSSAHPQIAAFQTSPSRKRFERGDTISNPSTAPPALLPLPLLPKSARSVSSQQQKPNPLQQTIAATLHSAPIVRAKYDLESNRSLEELLRKREKDLRRRREHVERLMQWHQRLDQEEAEVLQLEHMLLSCNNAHSLPQRHDCTTTTNDKTPISKNRQLEQVVSPSKVATATKSNELASQRNRRFAAREEKMERRLKEIDKSLRELSSMSTSGNAANSTTSDDNSNNACDNIEFVRTTGSKLNKLWRRLTSQQVEKFESNCRYKLCKADLERLYEEAKIAVLRDFAQDEEHRIAAELLDKTATSFSSSNSHLELANTNKVTIPNLNLNFSSGQSEQEEEDAVLVGEEVMLGESNAKKTTNFTHTLVPLDNYSPSGAEANFVMHSEKELEEKVSLNRSTTSIPPNSYTSSNSTTSLNSGDSDVATEKVVRDELIQRNVQKFLALTQRFNSTQNFDGLERSLSDTQLADNGAGVKKSTKNVANTTQRNIAYYGVKTQKKPSKIVNVEIANTLSSASSIFSGSANTLGYNESLPTQTIAESSAARNYAVSIPTTSNQSSAINTNAHSSNLRSDVANDIPTLSNTGVISTDSAESLPGSAAILSQTNIQPLNEISLQIIYPLSAGKKSDSTSAIKSDINCNSNSTTTRSLNTSEISSNVRETPSYTSASKSIFSAQHSKTADVNSTAREISAKLEEISAAVSMLSHSNSLQSGANSITSQPQQQQQQQSTNVIPSNFPPPTNNSENFDVQVDIAHSAVVSSPSSYSSNFENIDPEMQSPSSCTLKSSTSIRSSTLEQSLVPSLNQGLDSSATLKQSFTENRLLDKYETDFEDCDETRIDDISLPQFETTIETTQDDIDQEDADRDKEELQSLPSPPPPIMSERIAIAPSLTKSPVKKSFVDRESLPPPPPPPPPSSSASSLEVIASISTEAAAANSSIDKSSQQQVLTPDVINERELRRYQQIQQYEHVTAVPYMYMREIPNKPPPPYVPPAHGSPMTTIFPSEERIKDITYRRTHELYCKILKTEYTNEKGDKLPSITEEKITNIYERIILDICREYLDEHMEVLTKSDPTTFHSNLAFFNPPDRLRCIQTFVYKEVRRCLAMDKNQPKRKQVYSVYGQRAKRDHIGKIIIQEMYDEDDKWCNFHREENEVLDLIIEEMLNKIVRNLAKDVLIEEGGTVEEEEDEEVEVEEEETMGENAVKDVQLQQQNEESVPPLHEEELLESLCEELTTSLNVDEATRETSNNAAHDSIPSVQSAEKLAEDTATTKKDFRRKCMAKFKHSTNAATE